MAELTEENEEENADEEEDAELDADGVSDVGSGIDSGIGVFRDVILVLPHVLILSDCSSCSDDFQLSS